MIQNNVTPYSISSMEYLLNGWNPLPLPERKKSTPPRGYTGASGEFADEELVLGAWIEIGSNIALRMPPTVIGIDIDSSATKNGFKVFEDLIKDYGSLEVDFVVSNHESRFEGFTIFFQVPELQEGQTWVGSLPGGIDIISSGYRYQVAPPSIHPSGRIYSWKDWESFSNIPYTPHVNDLPFLPKKWIELLKKKKVTEKTTVKHTQNFDEINTNIEMNGSLCSLMKAIVNKRITGLKEEGIARHDSAVLASWAIVSEANKGHNGGAFALDLFWDEWKELFTDKEKTERDILAEWKLCISSAKEKMIKKVNSCNCGASYKKPYKANGARYKKRTVGSLAMWR